MEQFLPRSLPVGDDDNSGYSIVSRGLPKRKGSLPFLYSEDGYGKYIARFLVRSPKESDNDLIIY